MIETGKVLVVDIDGTIYTELKVKGDYSTAIPNEEFVAQLRAYKETGFHISLYTSRQMRTFDGNIGKINVHTLPSLVEWLKEHDIPFDELHVGKPWCGHEGFYIDDRAIRPREFIDNSYDEIMNLLKRDAQL
ncbi:hypothetical protein [Lysinibacillus piscis]|uniref:Capsular biosynthesis protein n=1 Tax=Lysinibacillus piscis TaxID=2518931 RepID=A0ABQ5NHG3_9BACI|nr:hypothetical protein [Lysinibacillus sp. KH24]GLC87796.1 hypothetical protein LYSBPC_09230 [Lysinibacillus sp. KH24]